MQDKNVYGALDAKFNSAPTPVNTTPAPETRAVKAALTEPAALIDDDFEQARNALKDMVKKGQDAVNDIMGNNQYFRLSGGEENHASRGQPVRKGVIGSTLQV